MKYFKLCAILFCTITASAQEDIGLRGSNYSGAYGNMLNPAAFNSGLLDWDLNLIGGGFFVHNSYQYVENTNLIHSIQNSGSLTFRSQDPEANLNPNALFYSFNDATRDMDNSFNAFLSLPSFLKKIGNYSFGIFSNFRMAFALNNLDQDLDNPSIEQWFFAETKFFDRTHMAGLVWIETGLNLGALLVKNRYNKIHLGVNIKYLSGLDGFYINSTERSQATGFTDTLQVVRGGDIEYGFSSGYATDNSGYSPEINGSGFALDIGVSYILNSYDKRPYRWKLGASLLDLGYIDFGTNAQKHYIPNNDSLLINYTELLNYEDIDDLVSTFSTQTLGDPTLSLIDNQITVYTPFSLSLQADYSITPNWFVGLFMVRRLDFSPKTVERENIWMGSIRYERKFFEAGTHLMLYNDINPRMGAWIRLGPFSLGSDNLTSIFITQEQFQGSDIYFALRLYPFRKKRDGRDRFELCNFKR